MTDFDIDNCDAGDFDIDKEIVATPNFDPYADNSNYLEHNYFNYSMALVLTNGKEVLAGVTLDSIVATSPSTISSVSIILPVPKKNCDKLIAKRLYRSNPQDSDIPCFLKETALTATHITDDVPNSGLGHRMPGIDYEEWGNAVSPSIGAGAAFLSLSAYAAIILVPIALIVMYLNQPKNDPYQAELDNNNFESYSTNEPVGNNDQSFEQIAREARTRALLEQADADAELGRIARERRAELMEEAISHSTSNAGGLLIDSYELPGNRFVACSMTFPGPIYSCDR